MRGVALWIGVWVGVGLWGVDAAGGGPTTALGCEVAALGVTAGEGDDPDDDGPSPSTERSRPAGLTRSSTTVPGVDLSLIHISEPTRPY